MPVVTGAWAGVGLSLVKGLIELHGGRVEAHSEGTGKGSEFVICLPLPSQPAAGKPASAEQLSTVERQAAPSSARRIFIVDDNIDAAEVLADLLSLLGHQVEIAHSGPEALARAASIQAHVILLDIGMPGMDGYEVARRLRQRTDLEKTRLVALSGYGGEDDRRRSREAGFDLHLVKPVDIDALAHVITAAQNDPSD
jgi:CheY-like chemotaxis protein